MFEIDDYCRVSGPDLPAFEGFVIGTKLQQTYGGRARSWSELLTPLRKRPPDFGPARRWFDDADLTLVPPDEAPCPDGEHVWETHVIPSTPGQPPGERVRSCKVCGLEDSGDD